MRHNEEEASASNVDSAFNRFSALAKVSTLVCMHILY
jgi:hypothetical protein